MTSFSFITASFNPGAMIEDCLGSVARQDPVPGVNHEHIIVDDGSTDASVASIKASGLPVKLIEQENRGQGAALNAGMRHVQGDWICWLPADDFMLPWSLAVVAAEIDPSVDVIFGDALFVDLRGRLMRLYAHHPMNRRALAGTNTLSPPATFYRSDVLDSWSEDMRLFLDRDLWLDLVERGCRFRYLPRPLAAFRRHSGQISQNVSHADSWEWHALAERHGLRLNRGSVLVGRGVRIALKAFTGGYRREIAARKLRGLDLRWFESDDVRHRIEQVFT